MSGGSGAEADVFTGFRFLRERQQTPALPWFEEHYENATREIVDFFEGDGISLTDKHVADIGCGDGIIDPGLVHTARPARLVGYDLLPVDTGALVSEARATGVDVDALPSTLEFAVSSEVSIPAENHIFDRVISWSTFEHVRTPIELLKDIKRVLRPDGYLFIQIWPLWYSQHGSHLWPWFPDGFAQFNHEDAEVHQTVREATPGRRRDAEFALEEYRRLNRMTVDELQRCLLSAGFFVTKFELLAPLTHIPLQLARFPLTDLGIAGIKLIAVPA